MLTAPSTVQEPDCAADGIHRFQTLKFRQQDTLSTHRWLHLSKGERMAVSPVAVHTARGCSQVQLLAAPGRSWPGSPHWRKLVTVDRCPSFPGKPSFTVNLTPSTPTWFPLFSLLLKLVAQSALSSCSSPHLPNPDSALAISSQVKTSIDKPGRLFSLDSIFLLVAFPYHLFSTMHSIFTVMRPSPCKEVLYPVGLAPHSPHTAPLTPGNHQPTWCFKPWLL
jgi:hypothetical protein